ncbi:MAG: response regulator, partial [Planctomycetes bacterium]|nr:response regulator [Planctomycetota bacterium]
VKYIQKTEEAAKVREKRLEMAARKVKVLVVDDSPLVRKILVGAINATADLEVCGEAGDAFEARDRILELDPDVISLDIIMPKLDGLKFLKSLSQHYPKPVVICSTIAKDQSQVAATAREYGAVDVIDKDALQLYKGETILQEVYIPKIRRAASKVVRKILFK